MFLGELFGAFRYFSVFLGEMLFGAFRCFSVLFGMLFGVFG